MSFEEITGLSHHFLALKNRKYRRYFIQREKLEHPLSIIIGQRGIGKTTTLVQYLLNLTKGDLFDPRILYVQADHFLMRTTTLYEIADQFVKMNGVCLAFDEIHKYPNWSQELKSICDTFPNLKVLASGSSALEIGRGSHDLSRRAIIYKMQGLSFREYLELQLHLSFESFDLDNILINHCQIAHAIIKRLNHEGKKILPLFQAYLQHGYYPYHFELKNPSLFEITLEQNMHTTIESDLAAIHPHLTGATIAKLKKLLAFIATSVPFTPNWKKLQELLHVGDMRTLKTYFQHLEDVGLIRTVTTASGKLAQLDAIGKVYLDNPNQMVVIGGENKDLGTLREIFFLAMLAEDHKLAIPQNGDFLVDDQFLFEIGGRRKNFNQIKKTQKSYLACDEIEEGIMNKISLWLFGFLY